MNILFISKYYPDSLIPNFQKYTKIGLDFAAQNLHKALLKGFQENKQKIDIINVPILGSFPPYYKSPFVSGYVSEKEHLKSISYINISYIKRLDINRKIEKEAIKWCNNTTGKKIIFFYNFSALPILSKIKKKYKDVKACLLLTDLPEYMSTDNSILTRINRSIRSIFFADDKKYFNLVDGFVLLAPDMRERIPIENKPWIHIEGIFNPEGIDINVDKDKEKVILYTGNISKRYGIIDLLDAFSKIKSHDYRLWIRGNGDTYDEIQHRMQKDNRIVYFDKMSKQELTILQKRATILINPVHSYEDFTRFFFPSKTLEYLASGTPTLMAPLKCMPKEYSQFVYYFKDESINGMAKQIIEICEKSSEEHRNFGKNASDFIYKYKTPKPQVEKIISFLNKI